MPSALLRSSVRRAILAELADELTIEAATEVVAVGWSARRAHRGESPATVATTSALVYSVGADLAVEFAGSAA